MQHVFTYIIAACEVVHVVCACGVCVCVCHSMHVVQIDTNMVLSILAYYL